MKCTIGLALAAGLAVAGAAVGQVDVTAPNGAHVHVDANGVNITASAGTTGTVHGHTAGTSAACLNGTINVSGVNEVLHVRGICSEVNLSGTNNTVYLSLAPGAHVALTGTRNHLHWSPADPRGEPPVIESPGIGNTYDRHM